MTFVCKSINYSHEGRKRSHWPRYITAVVEVEAGVLVRITCLHLGHRLEPRRLAEIEQIRLDLHNAADNVDLDVLTGDFNALTTTDYDRDELERVKEVRKRNKWEAPMTDVTDRIKNRFGYADAKAITRFCSGPLSTCRFDTRIDYFFFKARKGRELVVETLEHVDDAASDHNMVVVEITLNKATS